MSHAIISPAQLVLALLESIFNPSTQSIQISNLAGLVLRLVQMAHHLPSAISRQSIGVVGEGPVAPAAASTKDDFLNVALLSLTR